MKIKIKINKIKTKYIQMKNLEKNFLLFKSYFKNAIMMIKNWKKTGKKQTKYLNLKKMNIKI